MATWMHYSFLAHVVIFSASLRFVEGRIVWDYSEENGPAMWSKHFPKCGRGQRQSPINIDSRKAVKSSSFSSLRLVNTPVIDVRLENTGKALLATLDSDSLAAITGGPFGSVIYRVHQFHLHFAVRGKLGSEHTLDGVRAAAEIHLVAFNAKYGHSQPAMDKDDGLAVIGALIEVGERDRSDDIRRLFLTGSTLTNAGSSKNLSLSLSNILPPDVEKDFYFYNGSLTTPPCHESVTWIVARQHLTLTKETLDSLQALRTRVSPASSDEAVSENFRPVQPLNGRTVSYVGPGNIPVVSDEL